MYPYQYVRPSLFSRGLSFTKGINWSNLLDGTQKTLGVINQVIPIVYQVKPIISNARTMFKIADELKSPGTSKTNTSAKVTSTTNTNKPIFYM